MFKRITKALAAVLVSAMVVTVIPVAEINAEPLLIAANPNAADTVSADGFTVRQTAYNAVTVTFSDNDTAKKAVISVDRMKENGVKGTFYLKANAKTEVVDNTVVITRLSNGVKYRITVNGVEKTLEMNVGDPARIEINYPTAYISTNKDICGNSIKNATVTPVVTIYDANDVIVDMDSSALTYATEKKSNVGMSSLNTKTGLIKFSKVNSICYGTVTYTYTDSLGIKQTLSEFFTAYADEYTAPTISEVPASMVLTDKKGKNITYTVSDTFEGTLKVGDSMNIAYYFLGSDGKKYVTASNAEISLPNDEMLELSASRVFYLAKGDESATHISLYGNKIVGLSEGTEQIALYEKSATGSVDELVCVFDVTVEPALYPDGIELSTDNVRMLAFDNSDDYKGVPANYWTEEIKYTMTDQFGDAFADSTVSVYYVMSNGKEIKVESMDDAMVSQTEPKAGGFTVMYFDTEKHLDVVSSVWFENTYTVSKNGIYLIWDCGSEIPEEPVEFKVVADENPEVYETFTVELVKPEYFYDKFGEPDEIKPDGYELGFDTVNLTDRALWDKNEAKEVGTTIALYKTYDGLIAGAAGSYYVVSDSDTETIETYLKAEDDDEYIGMFYIVITDEEGAPITKTMAGEEGEIKVASEDPTEYYNDPTDKRKLFLFDTLYDLSNRTDGIDDNVYISIDDAYLTGNFTVTAYEVQSDYTLDEVASAEFSSENKVTGLQNASVNKLTLENGKVKDTGVAMWNSGDIALGTTLDGVVQKIADNFMVWFDADADGIADENTVIMVEGDAGYLYPKVTDYDEILMIYNKDENVDGKERTGVKDLGNFGIELTVYDASAVIGADEKEIYIKSFDYILKFEDTKLTYKGTISPRTKFVTSGIYIGD